jgi:uncharacterized protein YecT (DUF1311 family)
VITLIHTFMVASIVGTLPAQCDQAATTEEMQECLVEELNQKEEQLAAVEAEVAEAMAARHAVLVRRATLAWSLYRDLECESEAALYEPGTLAAVVRLQCRVRITDQRLRDLKTGFQPETNPRAKEPQVGVR